MKHIIKVDNLQDLINRAYAGDEAQQRVRINVEDEDCKLVKTITVRVMHDDDTDEYVVEWIP